MTATARPTRMVVGLAAGFVVLTGLVAIVATRDALVQPIDDWVRTRVVARQTTWLVDVAKVLSIVGAGWWAVAMRVGIAAALASLRRWLALAAFVGAAITTSLTTTVLKHWIDRPRPPGGLVHTTNAAYPSGHASAAAAIALGAYLAFAPRSHRRAWIAAALVWIVAMSLSRLILDVHWCSDVIGGSLLGATLALAWMPAFRRETETTAPKKE